jgi:hypothetical protein
MVPAKGCHKNEWLRRMVLVDVCIVLICMVLVNECFKNVKKKK